MVGLTVKTTRDEILKIMEEKEVLEREIRELTAVLESNNVDMHEPLVDSEGYPRNDIDVYRIRQARHMIIRLQNDHKELMRKIERGLHAVHAEIRGEGGSSLVNPQGSASNGHTANHTAGVSRMDEDHVDPALAGVVMGTNQLRVNERAIARVNLVSPGSPAEHAGLLEEDEILEFGSVNATNFNNLSQIANVVQHSVGQSLELKVRRGNRTLNLSLVPNTWPGRGLLGCNIVPIVQDL